MKRLQKASVLLSLIDNLKKGGSWCGETHIQKATFFLQGLLKVPLDYDYVLYKYGPYSFELDAELTELQADNLLRLMPQPPPYGPSLVPGSESNLIREKFPKTTAKYLPQVQFVAETLAGKRAAELERLSTALFVHIEFGGKKEARAKYLMELKPHVILSDAEEAVQFVDQLVDKCHQQGLSISE